MSTEKKTINYTEDQALALEFPGNVIISAGAGSGKTRVLVEKYFRLLVDDHPEWPVESVVAITFTRKAASELKSRIIRRVVEELESVEAEGPRRLRLQELRREVGAAPIGTIHNFCGRILREFAFDAHIDPDFVVLEGARESALRMEAARRTIREATSGQHEDLYAALLFLLNVFSAARLEQLLASMLSGRATYLPPARRFVATPTEELYRSLQVAHTEFVAEERRRFADQWLVLLKRIGAISLPGVVKQLCDSLVEQWPGNHEPWSQVEGLISAAMEKLLTKTFTCRKREFAVAGLEEFASERDALEELAKEYSKAPLGDLTTADEQNLDHTRHLARLFLKATNLYEELRGGNSLQDGEAQLVDFTDMELLAHKLVTSSAEVRHKLRQHYPFLILDEFQDTSQFQWEILRPLVVDEAGHLRRQCLFVVGDRKQGVYGFRDANVRLFSEVQNLVQASNEPWMGRTGAVTMAANFRTAEKPLTFINGIFEQLMSMDQSAWSVEFEPLQYMVGGEGCVEFLLCESPGKDELAESDEIPPSEPEFVALHIEQMITERNVRPGDIAILFRKRSAFVDYESALRERGIPVVSQHGANLFQQPELADLTAVLNAVSYPHRDAVFVHYLRSPFIGFTDDLLLKIARTHGRSYYDKALLVAQRGEYQLDSSWFALEAAEKERLAFALDTLNQAREMVGVYSPYEILKHLLDHLGAYYSVLAMHRGAQAQANIDKFLQVAREAEALDFEEFIEYVVSESSSLNGLTEAVDLATVDAVKIMTIHAAKGLEFPVVYLPQLNSGSGGAPDDVSTDGSEWMTLRLPKSLQDKPTFLSNYFARIARQQESAEERRILYVAMTRCQTHLVLSADQGARARGQTFFSWIADSFLAADEEGSLRRAEGYAGLAATAPQAAGPVQVRAGYRPPPSRDERVALALAEAGKVRDKENAGVGRVSKAVDPINTEVLPRLVQIFAQQGAAAARQYHQQQGQLRGAEKTTPWFQALRLVIEDLESFNRANRTLVAQPILWADAEAQARRLHPHIYCDNTYTWYCLTDDDVQLTRHEITLAKSGSLGESGAELRMVNCVAEAPLAP